MVQSIQSIPSVYACLSANAAPVLIGVAMALLDRQIAAQAKTFEAEGGFSEKVYRARTERRRGARIRAAQRGLSASRLRNMRTANGVHQAGQIILGGKRVHERRAQVKP